MDISIPNFETIVAICFVLAFLAYTVEYFVTILYDLVQGISLKAFNWLKAKRVGRVVTLLISWQIANGFHLGLITLFLKPTFELAAKTTTLDYIITAGIISGGSSMVNNYNKKIIAIRKQEEAKQVNIENKNGTE